MTKDTSLTYTVEIDRSPREVYTAINDPHSWWSSGIEGRADTVGAQFVFDSPGHHLWKFTVLELVPDQLVLWRVFDSTTNFVKDDEEWNDTMIRFDLEEKTGRTRLRFTHVGLRPELECFSECSRGWHGYITDSLPRLITQGHGCPGKY